MSSLFSHKTSKITILHSEIIDPTRADEQDTLMQMEAIKQALQQLGYEVCLVPFGKVETVCETFQKQRPTAVFNLVESIGGKSELLHFPASLLEYLQLPYSGNTASALFITTNKITSKIMMHAQGVPTPSWYYCGTTVNTDSLKHPSRWIVKPVDEEGSVGIYQDSVVDSDEAMIDGINKRMGEYGGRWFAEAYIEGREFNISIIETPEGIQVLPIAEILFEAMQGAQIVTYDAKWSPDHPEYLATPRHFPNDTADAALFANLRDLALKCWKAFGLKGYARLDVRVDENGNPWVLEINANPCIAPDAGFTAAAARDGIDMKTIVKWLLSAALSYGAHQSRGIN